MYLNNDIDYLKYLEKKETIIFGAGENGKKGLAKLKDKTKVIAFCDNDKNKHVKVVQGVSVLSFEELCKQNNQNTMIIICSRYEREIRQQLSDQNIFNFISISQVDFGGGEEYYDENYFAYQQQIGEFGGKISNK